MPLTLIPALTPTLTLTRSTVFRVEGRPVYGAPNPALALTLALTLTLSLTRSAFFRFEGSPVYGVLTKLESALNPSRLNLPFFLHS